MQIKAQWGIIEHLVECLFKKLIVLNVGVGAEQLQFSYIPGGNANGTVTWKTIWQLLTVIHTSNI